MAVDFPSPPTDPSDLASFPTRRLRAGATVSRIHHADLGPYWFSSFPADHPAGGRFDLRPPDGTSYWALDGEAAFLETIARRPIAVLPIELLDRYQYSTGPLPRDLDAANAPVKRARAFGLTAEFHTTADYTATRPWAAALAAAGHDALLAFPRHDVTGRLRSLALFGTAGEHAPFGWQWKVDTGPIPSTLIDAMSAWGIRCIPIPFDVDVVRPNPAKPTR